MMHRINRVVLVGVVALGAWPARNVEAQGLRLTQFFVNQEPALGGGLTYTLKINLAGVSDAGVPDDGAKLVAPDGTELDGIMNEVQFNSFAELGALLFGDWIVTERPLMGTARSYTLRVRPFSLNDVFTDTPIITSPTPGATVPTDFIVKWDYLGDEESPGTGINLRDAQNLQFVDHQHGTDGRYSVRYQLRLRGPAPGQFSFQTFAQTSLPAPTSVSRDPALNGVIITRTLTFNSNSQWATFYVVPEPGGIGLCGLVVLLGAVSRVTASAQRRTRLAH
jgi:hypothetical protein